MCSRELDIEETKEELPGNGRNEGDSENRKELTLLSNHRRNCGHYGTYQASVRWAGRARCHLCAFKLYDASDELEI